MNNVVIKNIQYKYRITSDSLLRQCKGVLKEKLNCYNISFSPNYIYFDINSNNILKNKKEVQDIIYNIIRDKMIKK